MQVTDTIADLLTRIRNAQAARHDTVEVPASNMKKAICQILVDEGYVKGFNVTEDGKQGMITITLKYVGKQPVIKGLKRVSKPGLRIYSNAQELPKVMKGLKTSAAKCWRSFGKKRGCESMSRIGRKPINIPAGVEVNVNGSEVTVKGPKGTLAQSFNPKMSIAVEGSDILVTRPDDEKESRSLHGLTRTLIHNMVVGVTEGFSKTLEVQGVGYRVQKQGKDLVMNLGYSHQVIVSENEDIKIDAPNANTIVISGIDKQKVGQFAAEVREKRPPEGEFVRRKEGKAGKGSK